MIARLSFPAQKLWPGPVNAVLGAIFGMLLWSAARSLYSTGAANLALALFAFSSSLIAHFSLAGTNDGVMALMTFATAFQLYRWRHKPSLFQTALLGLVLGGLLLAKTSSLPLFAVAVGLVLILKTNAISPSTNGWNFKELSCRKRRLKRIRVELPDVQGLNPRSWKEFSDPTRRARLS